MAQSAVEVKSFGVIQKAELKSQIIIATFQVRRPSLGKIKLKNLSKDYRMEENVERNSEFTKNTFPN